MVLAIKEPTEAEGKVLEASKTGAIVDLRTGNPDLDIPAEGHNWSAERQVRARLLCEVLGGLLDWKPHAIKLAGACITGSLDLEELSVVCPLMLYRCFLEEGVGFNEVEAPALRLPGCNVPTLTARQISTRGNLELNDGFTTDGEVDLSGAHIGGVLNLAGANLINNDGPALSASSLTVEQGMYCSEGFIARGGVYLPGSHIKGVLSFVGAYLVNPSYSTDPKAHALFADGLTVDRDVYCRHGFAAEGEVRMLGAHIGGELSFTGATLTNPTGYALQAQAIQVGHDLKCRKGMTVKGGISLIGAHVGGTVDFHGSQLINSENCALSASGLTVEQNMDCGEGFTALGEVDLSGAHINGQLKFDQATLASPTQVALQLQHLQARELRLQLQAPPAGIIDFTHCRVTTLVDHPATWPQHQHLKLRGFVYDALDEATPVDVATRLDWLERDAEGYIPQPYEQLAAVYRRAGYEEGARKVIITKQRRRRQTLNWPGKVWNSILYWTVGYGYRTWQAGIGLLILVALGWIIFNLARFTNPSHLPPTKDLAERPTFQGALYALDLLLPIVDLGYQGAWVARGWARWWWLTWILAGWVLTTAVVAAVTGLIKRD
jgi:hypothetical protein